MNNLFTTNGGIPPYGILISHSWNEVGAIFQVMQENAVDCFIEIGVHRGGLSSLIIPYCYYNPDFKYLGIDIDRKIVEPSILFFVSFLDNAKLYYNDENSINTIRMARGMIEKAKHPLIYCDGGNKPREFKAYSAIAETGTLLMVHDYPLEFNEKHFDGIKNMQRMELDYLEGTRQVLFRKLE